MVKRKGSKPKKNSKQKRIVKPIKKTAKKPLKKSARQIIKPNKKAGKIRLSKSAREYTEKVEQKLVQKRAVGDVFWADQIANELIERAKKEDTPVVCKCAASPSGGKHVGNMFDVMKAYFIYKAVLKKKYSAKFIFTSDDRDPLRTIPAKIPTLDAKMVSTEGEIEEKMKQHVGKPYTDVPDPFECCSSWAEHFTRVWLDGIFAGGVSENDLKVFSNSALYNEGKFDPYFEIVLKKIQQVRETMMQFQETTPLDYIPIQAICEKCGKITTKVTAFDIQKKTVTYECSGRELAGKYKIEGCGNIGETSFHNCKLAWRFETPAQMGIFGVLCEPFGKEHAEGTVKSTNEITRKIYGFDPPMMPIYEFLLLNGEKMSSRRGNAYIVQEMLDIIEPEVLAFLYTKKSTVQRNLDIKNIHLLVNDFEKAERVYFGKEKVANENDRITLIRSYESAMPVIPKIIPIRIDYQFASVVAQISGGDVDTAIRMLRSTGHIDPSNRTIDNNERERIRTRLNLASNWVNTFTPENKIKINADIPDGMIKSMTIEQKNAVKDLAKMLNRNYDQQQLYNSFYEICNQHNLKPSDFFKAMYRILINKDSGPRLAPFIIALDRTRVRQLLEQIK